LLRAGENDLSVDWIEILKCPNRKAELVRLREVYASRFTIGATAKIAILNVGETCDKVLNETPDKRVLDVRHNPLKNDEDPHSSIYNLREDDELIAEVMVECILEFHNARA